ncbi:hypothetical protein Q9189_000280 [Teloschistes chrysophthalmus]
MSSTNPPQQSSLLRLPPELRIMVYSFLHHREIHRSLRVCRQLYKETHRMFYEQFCLNLDVFSDGIRPVFRVRVDHPEKPLPYPLPTHRAPKKWSYQLHLGHGQNGNWVMDRLDSMPEPSKANLQAVKLFNGSFLEHLEVWIPKRLMRNTVFSERLNAAAIVQPLDQWRIDALGLNEELRFVKPIWVHYLTKITGLKSIRIMLWNDYERTS